MGRLPPRVRSPLNLSRSAYPACGNRRFRGGQYSGSPMRKQFKPFFHVTGRDKRGNKIFAIHQCVDDPAILGGLSATRKQWGQVLVNAVDSMGRRNTRPKSTYRASIAKNRSRALI